MNDSEHRVRLALATDADRPTIYRMRHDVYARELGQHATRPDGELRDELDETNVYIVAWYDGCLAGFISITPPGGRFSMDKYLARTDLPFPFNAALFELRLLTVARRYRNSRVACLLMHAALRWVESRGATRLMGIGRREVMGLYRRVGFRPLGVQIQSGAVYFEAMAMNRSEWESARLRFMPLLNRLESQTGWEIGVPYRTPGACFHGGAFFEAIGESFDDLDRRRDVVNADVLDAWFPPAPGVVESLQRHLPWLARTSPPTGAKGLVRTIARARGIPEAAVLPGAGSSTLIYLAFRHWLTRASRVLILDPTYGEYAHVLEMVIGCTVDRFELARREDYDMNLARLKDRIGLYDLVVLVNPNSPTGRHIPRASLEAVLVEMPAGTRVWVDEAYVEYVGGGQSLEPFAATRPNIVVCKSMSKAYALSGLRVAYLCAHPSLLDDLRTLSPPWSVGLLAQVAAVTALEDPNYYAMRHQETRGLKRDLAAGLAQLGIEVVPGAANFVLCHLPEGGIDAAEAVSRSRTHNVYIRDARDMGTGLGSHALRIAVKDAPQNRRILAVLKEVLYTEACAARIDSDPSHYGPVSQPILREQNCG